MSEPIIQQNVIRDQYRDSSNLNARARLHARYSTNPQGWFNWYLDQLNLTGGLTPGSRILELGCGPAGLWRDAFEHQPPGWLAGQQITLTDFSYGMVTETRQWMSAQALDQVGGAFTYASVDAQNIPFPDASFDLVLANHMLYHVPEPARAIAEIRRVLRPSGRLFAATNGIQHMAALDDLVARLAVIDALGRVALSFTLENGPALLAASFKQVELRRYPDNLVVDEAQPLVDYVLSMVNFICKPPSAEQVQRFKAEIEREIQTNGAITIAKDAGILIAAG